MTSMDLTWFNTASKMMKTVLSELIKVVDADVWKAYYKLELSEDL